MALSPRELMQKRAQRVRLRLKQVSNGRPRLSVFRSSKNIYAQLIDDEQGVTVAAASSLEGEGKGKRGSDKDAAAMAEFDCCRLGDDYGYDEARDCWWAKDARGRMFRFEIEPLRVADVAA